MARREKDAGWICCETIQAFIHHPGYKYSKYKQALEFICAHGYIAFMKAAEHWKNACGKYDAI